MKFSRSVQTVVLAVMIFCLVSPQSLMARRFGGGFHQGGGGWGGTHRGSIGHTSMHRGSRGVSGRHSGIHYAPMGVSAHHSSVQRGPRGVGYRHHSYHGHGYYHHGYHHFGVYHHNGYMYHRWLWPPWGTYYYHVPVGAILLTIGAATYWSSDNVYYQETEQDGNTAYEVVPAPAGTQVTVLPAGTARLTVGELDYYFYANTFYRLVTEGDQQVYVVVQPPAGLPSITQLPSDFEPVTEGKVTFFRSGSSYYVPYLKTDQKEIYLPVDPPANAVAAVPYDPDAQPAPSAPTGFQSTVTVPFHTALNVRTAQDLNSGKNKTGDAFVAYLDSNLIVNNQIVAAKGTKMFGHLSEVKKAGHFTHHAEISIQLTGIVLDGKTVSLETNTLTYNGENPHGLAKVGVGAGVGAAVGARAGTQCAGWVCRTDGSDAAKGAAIGAAAGLAVAAATGGKEVDIADQALLQFNLNAPLTVQFSTPSPVAQ